MKVKYKSTDNTFFISYRCFYIIFFEKYPINVRKLSYKCPLVRQS